MTAAVAVAFAGVEAEAADPIIAAADLTDLVAAQASYRVAAVAVVVADVDVNVDNNVNDNKKRKKREK